MTNVQFITLLSTAIGSFVLVILAWLNQNQRLNDFREDVKRHFDHSEASVNARLSDLREDMNRQFDRIDSRLSLIEGDQKEFFTVTGKLDGRIEQLSRVK